MKNYINGIFNKIKSLILKNKWWTALVVIILIIATLVILSRKKDTAIELIVVQKHDVVEEVSVTGNVKPTSDLDLSFRTSGQISNIAVSTGDRVYQGQYLASLSNADLAATVSQAKAGLKVAQANLSSGLITTKSLLDDSKVSLESKIADAYTKVDGAIRNNTDQMFDNPRISSVKINLILNNSQLENDINTARYNIESMLNDWNMKGSSLPVDTAYSYLDQTKAFLDKLALGINNLNTSSGLTQTTLDRYKSAVSSARDLVGLAYSNLNLANSAYNSAKINYNLVFSENASDNLSAQEAAVEQAKANVDAAVAQLNKSIIVSPISGVITHIEAKVGQTMQSGVTALSVISYGQYDVESFIPEADIAKVKIGDFATTTLDAYGSDTFFQTKVVKIDPAETIIENVPTYKVILKFIPDSDKRIKSGMTANLDIVTNKKNAVLAVPSRSVYTIDNKKYVKIIDPKDSKKTIETKVETGIRGVDGYIEIISGLKEGDKIMSSPNI